MPTRTLTVDFLKDITLIKPEKGIVSYFDTELKGFMLECRSSGSATYYFRYRDIAGKIRLNKIGRYDQVTLSDARAKAYSMKQMVTEGGDPKLESRRFKDVPTVQEFVTERFIPYIQVHKRSWKTDEIMLRIHILPVLGARRLNRVFRSDIVELHHKDKEKGYAPGTCNRMVILLKFMYNCAIRWDILPHGSNPCEGVQYFEDHGAKERFLTHEEVGHLFDELDSNPNVMVGQVIRLLLFTGARKREVLDARWDEIDWDRRLLIVPAERSKSKKIRFIPLSDAAIALLESLPRKDDIPYVFFNSRTKKPPVSIFYAWDSIRRKVGIPDVRLHDLRHSFASFLVNAGRSLYEVQKLLGHHDPKVTMRYAHLAPGTMQDAVNMVGQIVGDCKRASY